MPRNNAIRQAPMAVPHGPFQEFTPEEVARDFAEKMLAEERLAERLGVDPVFVRLAKEIGFTKDEQEVTTIIRIAKGELAPEDVSERDYVRDRYERFANIILELDWIRAGERYQQQHGNQTFNPYLWGNGPSPD